MLKKLFIISLMSISSLGAMLTPVTKNHVRQYKPGAFKDAEGFGIRKNGTVTRVHAYDVEKQLRNLPSAKFNSASKYIVASKMTNGDMRLSLKSHLPGGPAIGAAVGYWAGWLAVNTVGVGITFLASSGTTVVVTASTGNPFAGMAAGKAVGQAVNTAIQPAVQIIAQKVAIASAVTLGTVIPV